MPRGYSNSTGLPLNLGRHHGSRALIIRTQGCLHYWIIDGVNVGQCKYCGAIKDFGRLLSKEKLPWLYSDIKAE